MRIALVEPGGERNSASIKDPASWPCNLTGTADRGYTTTAQKQLNNRQLQYARGVGVGGSSLLNVMLYTRCFRDDWDDMHVEGWGSADISPDFDWVEEKLALSSVKPNVYGQLVRQAANSIGIADSKSGDWATHGTTSAQGYQVTVDTKGERTDIYRAFEADHPAVHLVQGAAEKILFAKGGTSTPSAEAVQLRKSDGTVETIRVVAGGEIILCCGAIDTPKLLQLSGIGPVELLTKLCIPIIHNLEQVGEGLKDHPMLPLGFWYTGKPMGDLSMNSIAGWLHDEPAGVQLLWVDGKSAAAIMPSALVAPWRKGSREGTGLSAAMGGMFDSCVLGIMLLVGELLRLLLCIPIFRSQLDRVIGLNVAVVRPVSRGSCMICSADPADAPCIDPALLSDEKDMQAMLDGISTVRKLVSSAPLSAVVGLELLPGPLFGSENELVHVRANTSTFYHPTGTCAIGSCVDAQTLRLHGVKGLRVADASVLPLQPRGPVAGACMAVGARCANLLVKARAA
jgi:choline dehydrogenase